MPRSRRQCGLLANMMSKYSDGLPNRLSTTVKTVGWIAFSCKFCVFKKNTSSKLPLDQTE